MAYENLKFQTVFTPLLIQKMDNNKEKMSDDYQFIDVDGETHEVIVEEDDYFEEGEEPLEEVIEEFEEGEENGEEDDVLTPQNLEPLDQPFFDICAHLDAVYCVSFSHHDDNLLLTGSGDDKGYFWDISEVLDDKEVEADFARYTIDKHSETVSQVSFSYDGKYFATGGLESVVHIWNTGSGELVRTFGEESTEEMGVSCMTWFEKHPVLLYGLEDGSAWLWEVEKGKLLHTLYGHAASITSCMFNHAGNRVLTSSDDCTLKIWSPAKGNLIHTIQGHNFHEDSVTSMKCHKNDKIVLSGGQDKAVCISNIETGKALSRLEGHSESVESVDFAHDFKWGVSSGVDGKINVWDLGNSQLRQTISNDAVGITRMKCLGYNVITTDVNGYIKVWDIRSGRIIKSIHAHADAILDFDISKSRKFIATASDDFRACIFSLESILV